MYRLCAEALGSDIVADNDGVVVVPQEEAEAVLREAIEHDQAEERMRQRLKGGEFTVDILNLRKDLPSRG